jgi:hypothetical protein
MHIIFTLSKGCLWLAAEYWVKQDIIKALSKLSHTYLTLAQLAEHETVVEIGNNLGVAGSIPAGEIKFQGFEWWQTEVGSITLLYMI